MIHYAHGRFTEGNIGLSPELPAFRYGAGFFETVYYNGSTLCHLTAHLDRVHASLAHFGFVREEADLPRIMAEALERNGLTGRPARVNIFYPVESGPCSPVVLAAPHEPQPDRVLALHSCPDHHVSSLCAHKSMNHFFYYLARTRALAAGFDDAVLTDQQGLLLETSLAALLLAKAGKFVEPATPFKLPSTALDAARPLLPIETRPVHMNELESFDHVFALNSVMGMRPVVRVDGSLFDPDEATCARVSRIVLS